MPGVISGCAQNPSHETAKKIYRQFIPDAAILNAVEDPLSHQFEKWMRGREVKKPIGFPVRNKTGATLN